jgi:hypothetical protein
VTHRVFSFLYLFTALELASLAILLTNLATADSRQLAAAVGPIHGALYLCVIISVARHPRTTHRITALSCLPAVGGALALRRLSSRTSSGARVDSD